MMSDELIRLINKYESEGDFTYTTVTEDMLKEAEDQLSERIPDEYKAFLQNYGHGGIGGMEVLGVGKNGMMVFVKETLDYREHGLPRDLIIIENCDEWLYCINVNTEEVVRWYIGADSYKVVYSSFNMFLEDRLNDVIENMQE